MSITPRRSSRLNNSCTPKMSERKRGLLSDGINNFKDLLTKHRDTKVFDSDCEDDSDLVIGIINSADSSSGDEIDLNKNGDTPVWYDTRSKTTRSSKRMDDLKTFINSPFTLTKYRTRYSCPDTCYKSHSNPTTPHLMKNSDTPSSTRSCNSGHTSSSTNSKARKSLANLIADTESCSSSLKDLNFDSDSSSDGKENTPRKTRKSNRVSKMTPKYKSFKGILLEQNNDIVMKNPVVRLTKMDVDMKMSPTNVLKTPQNSSEVNTPPKLVSNRKSLVIAQSPELSCDGENNLKRLRNNSLTDEPNPKCMKTDAQNAPKARLSLFNSDSLQVAVSAKSFYGFTDKSTIVNTAKTTMNSSYKVMDSKTRLNQNVFKSSSKLRKKKKYGQINIGVKHKIRKPRFLKVAQSKHLVSKDEKLISKTVKTNHEACSKKLPEESPKASREDFDKRDPFDNVKQTIDELLSQWDEEDLPYNEVSTVKSGSNLFSKSVMEETSSILQPVAAIPVSVNEPIQNSQAVIVELGKGNIVQKDILDTNGVCEGDVVMFGERVDHVSDHGVPMNGQFLPVEGGYIYVDDCEGEAKEIDLDKIEEEMQKLDEKILAIAESNNINGKALLESTEMGINVPCGEQAVISRQNEDSNHTSKLFPIFENPNPGIIETVAKVPEKPTKKMILKSMRDQYVIDAGQKKFGITQCAECGSIYELGDPQDEHDHLIHHNAIDVLRFNGWKDETVVGEWDGARCIRVRGGAAGWKRVVALLTRIVHLQLGYSTKLPRPDEHYTAYLYIEKKQIVGCTVVEPKSRAFRLLPGDPDCCTTEDYPVKCGVSRIWTHAKYRQRGVASRMLDCARATFAYGSAISKGEIAFSAPTTQGKVFATKYCGTQNFYIYLEFYAIGAAV